MAASSLPKRLCSILHSSSILSIQANVIQVLVVLIQSLVSFYSLPLDASSPVTLSSQFISDLLDLLTSRTYSLSIITDTLHIIKTLISTRTSFPLFSFTAAYEALIQPSRQDLITFLQIIHYATHSLQCRSLAQSILETLHSPLTYPAVLHPHAEDLETALFEACIQQFTNENDSVVNEALECCLEAAVQNSPAFNRVFESANGLNGILSILRGKCNEEHDSLLHQALRLMILCVENEQWNPSQVKLVMIVVLCKVTERRNHCEECVQKAMLLLKHICVTGWNRMKSLFLEESYAQIELRIPHFAQFLSPNTSPSILDSILHLFLPLLNSPSAIEAFKQSNLIHRLLTLIHSNSTPPLQGLCVHMVVFLLDDYEITRHTVRILLKPSLSLLNEPHPMEDKQLVIRLYQMLKRLLIVSPKAAEGVVRCHFLLRLEQLLRLFGSDNTFVEIVYDLIPLCCVEDSDGDFVASGLMNEIQNCLMNHMKNHNVVMMTKGLQVCDQIFTQCELTRSSVMEEIWLNDLISIMKQFFSQSDIIVLAIHTIMRMTDNQITRSIATENTSLPSLLRSLYSCYSSLPAVFESSQQLLSLLSCQDQSSDRVSPAVISSNSRNASILEIVKAMKETSGEAEVMKLSNELPSLCQQTESLENCISILLPCQSLVCSFSSNPNIVTNLLTVISMILDNSIIERDFLDSAFKSFVRSELMNPDCPYAFHLIDIVRSACAKNVFFFTDVSEVQEIAEKYIGSGEAMTQEITGIIYEVCRNSPDFCHSMISRYGDS